MFRIRLGYKIITGALLTGLAVAFLLNAGTKPTAIFAGDSTVAQAHHPVITFSFDGSARTLAAAFAQAGQTYRPEDHIQVFPPDLQSGLGGIIVDSQAMAVKLIDGTKTFTAYTWATSIEGLLEEQNITLGDQDKITPALTSDLEPNQTITIVRVAITQLTEHQTIKYETVKKDDNTLDKGKTKVQKAGVNGQKALLYRVRREDGVEVNRTLLSTTITKPAEAEILLVGTKPVITVPCAGYDDLILAAAIKNGVDPNLLCKGMMLESNGHPNSIGAGQYYGLFQYTQSFWAQASAMCGYSGAAWTNATAQINVTACALHKGYNSRWFWAG